MAAKFTNILRVGGITLPDPSKMTIEDYDISVSKRNANGKMIAQIIRENVHKLVCEWALIRPEEYMLIRGAIKKKFDLNIYFFIPDLNVEGKLVMYAGDRKTPIYTYRNRVPVYRGFAMNFIEM